MPSNARNIEFFIKYAPITELLFIPAPDKKGEKPQLPIGLLDRERGCDELLNTKSWINIFLNIFCLLES